MRKNDVNFNIEPMYSVITPMYNSFDLMGKYLDSLEKQMYKSFEVIVVDDCSSDDSYTKLREYSKTTNLNIKIYKTDKNSGPGIARNIGIDKCSGEWILFVDSDDYVSNNLFFELNNIKINNVDCFMFDFFRVNKGNCKHCSTLSNLNQGPVEQKDVLINSNSNVCGKVFRQSIVRTMKVKFPSLNRFEDWSFDYQMYLKCSSFYYLKKPLYFYLDNKNSLVNKACKNIYVSSFKAFETFDKDIRENDINIAEAVFIREVIYTFFKNDLLFKKNKDIDMIINDLSKNYPNWKNNQYIKTFSKNQQFILFLGSHKFYFLLKLLLTMVN